MDFKSPPRREMGKVMDMDTGHGHGNGHGHGHRHGHEYKHGHGRAHALAHSHGYVNNMENCGKTCRLKANLPLENFARSLQVWLLLIIHRVLF
jgi:hypothetical protein